MKKIVNLMKAKLHKIDPAKLAKYKAGNPNRLDYGLGEAEITLQGTEEIRNFLLDNGVSLKGKKPKTFVTSYKRDVGRAADHLLAFYNRKERYIGACCYAGTVREFLSLSMGEWLQIMKANFPSVWYNKLDPAQEKSWHTTFKTLKSSLKQLPAYHDLTIVFEYVLPTRPAKSKKALYSQIGVRADVMLISKGKVGIIEFKDRPLKSYTDMSVVSKQANKYATRIKRFHSMSQNMTVSTVALMLQDEQLCRFDKDTNVKFYSPDNMTDALVYLVGKKPARHPKPDRWIQSDWNVASK